MRLFTVFVSSAFVLAGLSTALPVDRHMLVARFADSDFLPEVEARAYDKEPGLYAHGGAVNYRRSFYEPPRYELIRRRAEDRPAITGIISSLVLRSERPRPPIGQQTPDGRPPPPHSYYGSAPPRPRLSLHAPNIHQGPQSQLPLSPHGPLPLLPLSPHGPPLPYDVPPAPLHRVLSLPSSPQTSTPGPPSPGPPLSPSDQPPAPQYRVLSLPSSPQTPNPAGPRPQ